MEPPPEPGFPATLCRWVGEIVQSSPEGTRLTLLELIIGAGACQSLGDAQTAMARAGTWLSLAAMAGYQVVNRSRSVPSRALVRVCRSRWAPCFDHCISSTTASAVSWRSVG